MKNVLLTLAVLTAIASTEAFAQRGRLNEVRPDSNKQRANETAEEAKRRALKAAPGLADPRGKARQESADAAKVAFFVEGLKGTEQTALASRLSSLTAEVPAWDAIVTEVNAAKGVEKIDMGNGVKRNNADAFVNLVKALNEKGLLTKEATSAPGEAKETDAKAFDLQMFGAQQGITVIKGASSKSFIQTLDLAATAIRSGKTVFEAFYEAITRDYTDPAAKRAEMDRFCKACPGACK